MGAVRRRIARRLVDRPAVCSPGWYNRGEKRRQHERPRPGKGPRVNAGDARFGRHELLGVLGSGSFATVYRGHDPLLRRDVAIKALYPHLAADPDSRQRFLAEARALAALRHPHIVAVHDVGEADGRPYFVMDLVQGRTLADLLAARGQLSLAEAATLLSGLAQAVDALHAAGLVHRDITAANVMVTHDGRAVLMDFGIAFAAGGTRLTRGGYGLGTPVSAAPEQIRGENVGPAADIYALGVLAYAMLAGYPPFQGDTAHVLYAHAHLTPPSLVAIRSELPPAVAAAIQAALAKDPAARPASALQFVAPIAAAAWPDRPPPGGYPMAATEMLGAEPMATGVPLHSETGKTALTLALLPGLTCLHLRYDHPGGSPLTLQLETGEGRAIERLRAISGPYAGTRALVAPAEGLYRLTAEAAGPWMCAVDQPVIARQPATTRAGGAGDAVVFVQMAAGVRRVHLMHRLWRGGFFRASLVDAGAAAMDRLVVTTGGYDSAATRRVARDGVHALVVEASGAWTAAVE